MNGEYEEGGRWSARATRSREAHVPPLWKPKDLRRHPSEKRSRPLLTVLLWVRVQTPSPQPRIQFVPANSHRGCRCLEEREFGPTANACSRHNVTATSGKIGFWCDKSTQKFFMAAIECGLTSHARSCIFCTTNRSGPYRVERSSRVSLGRWAFPWRGIAQAPSGISP